MGCQLTKWNNKVVVVTGGSKGLGFEIARAFGLAGARVVLLARTEPDLVSATEQLRSEGVDSNYWVTDVSSESSVRSVFERIASKLGRIDVLVNNVGKSTRANIEELDLDEAIQLMDINYFSALRCVKFALKEILKSRGSVVNVGSLVSKTAWPYMTPYTASKHALAALSSQLRIELGDRIHSLLVCSGPITRSDSGKRYHDQSSSLPENAARPGAGANVKTICPMRLSLQIVRACEKRRSELIVPFKAKILFVLTSLSTRIGDWLLKKSQKK